MWSQKDSEGKRWVFVSTEVEVLSNLPCTDF